MYSFLVLVLFLLLDFEAWSRRRTRRIRLFLSR